MQNMTLLRPEPDPMRSLGHALAMAQDAVYAARRSDHVPARARFLMRLAAEAGRKRRARRRAAIGMSLAFAALVVLAVGTLRLPEDGALLSFVVSDGTPGATQAWIAAPTERSLGLQFSDGSQVDLWPRASARVLELDARGATIALEHGRADVEIVPHEGRRWFVEAGPFRVTVLGTGFSVEWEPESGAFRLDLHHGQVEVSGPTLATSRTLSPGEHLFVRSFDAVAGAADLAEATVAADVLVPVAGVSPGVPHAARPSAAVTRRSHADVTRGTTPRPEPAEPDAWLVSARAGHFDRALREAEAQGFEQLCDTLRAGDLLTLADVARYARAPERARRALLGLRDRFPGSDAAATAAFDLGRMHATDCTRARRWFEVVLEERPESSMAAAAVRRLQECAPPSP